jgi:hypothetical protein
MVCYTSTIVGCPGNDDLSFVFGVAPPAAGKPPLGTIVFFSGDGGDVAENGTDQNNLLTVYINDGFQLVEIAWGSPTAIDWEFTNVSGGGNPYSILAAACRPATFLNWVRNSNSGVGNGIWSNYGKGMCAQGHSAGSAALAYALAWYNAGSATLANGSGYLDKATFTSGPVFSDIKQGCEVINNQTTTICGSPGQVGCVGWTGQQPRSLEYVTGYKSEVNEWSGNYAPISCANNVQGTSSSQNANWFQQSILYNGGTQQPSFNYPKTTISAWLCDTVKTGVQSNNAPSQGQLYWAEFTSLTQAGNSLSVNAVENCPETEDVIGGTLEVNPSESGQTAIDQDMTAECVSKR